jgi:hypothetical protein
MLPDLLDANDFVYRTALRVEREDGGLVGWQVFVLLCGKNPWFQGNKYSYRTGVVVSNLTNIDMEMLNRLLDQSIYYRTDTAEGMTSLTNEHPIEFWLSWFSKNGVKLESEAYKKLSRDAGVLLAGSRKWPWGNYETDGLRMMEKAIEKFWVLYDPAQPDTAPTNEVVEAWLREQGMSPRKAEAVASLIRADALPLGRRRS